MIQTRAVREAIGGRNTSGVLSMAAPDVDEAMADLPRTLRKTLSQLRSEYCSSLNTFKHYIDPSLPPVRPCCRHADHTTGYLFVCPEHPTGLTPLDLWQRPREAV